MKIRIGDLNGDQLQDVAGIDYGTDHEAVLLQNESGMVDPERFYCAPHEGLDDLVIDDVNADGLLEEKNLFPFFCQEKGLG